MFDPPGTESASRTFSSRQTLPPCESRGPGRGRAGPKPPASAPPPPPFALPPPPPPATAAGGGTRAALPASLLGFHIPLADAPTPLCSSSPVQAGHLLLPRRPQGVHQPRAHKVPHRMPCLACLPHSCSISSVLSLHALLAPRHCRCSCGAAPSRQLSRQLTPFPATAAPPPPCLPAARRCRATRCGRM